MSESDSHVGELWDELLKKFVHVAFYESTYYTKLQISVSSLPPFNNLLVGNLLPVGSLLVGSLPADNLLARSLLARSLCVLHIT